MDLPALLHGIGEISSRLLIWCALTRFIVARKLPNLRPKTWISGFLNGRVMYSGRMNRLISDRGPGLVGVEWDLFTEAWDIIRVLAPKESVSRNGIAELQVDLVNSGFVKAKGVESDYSTAGVLQKVVPARNTTPNFGPGVSPMRGMTGMADLLSPLEWRPQVIGNSVSDSSANSLLRLQERHRHLATLRRYLGKREAELAISARNTRSLRAGEK